MLNARLGTVTNRSAHFRPHDPGNIGSVKASFASSRADNVYIRPPSASRVMTEAR